METLIIGLGLYRDNGKENGNHYLGFRGWRRWPTRVLGA